MTDAAIANGTSTVPELAVVLNSMRILKEANLRSPALVTVVGGAAAAVVVVSLGHEHDFVDYWPLCELERKHQSYKGLLNHSSGEDGAS